MNKTTLESILLASPRKFRWAAMDTTGHCFLYSKKPTKRDRFNDWGTPNNCISILINRLVEEKPVIWEESLISRDEIEKADFGEDIGLNPTLQEIDLKKPGIVAGNAKVWVSEDRKTWIESYLFSVVKKDDDSFLYCVWGNGLTAEQSGFDPFFLKKFAYCSLTTPDPVKKKRFMNQFEIIEFVHKLSLNDCVVVRYDSGEWRNFCYFNYADTNKEKYEWAILKGGIVGEPHKFEVEE